MLAVAVAWGVVCTTGVGVEFTEGLLERETAKRPAPIRINISSPTPAMIAITESPAFARL